MRGRIYISGAFTCHSSKCNPMGQLDNDPHFWEKPPTWGICRPDIRENLKIGDYIFYVLPNKSDMPQMVYGYMQIKEKISHASAYHRPELFLKRMGNKKNPNGNIMVDSRGNYNPFDKNRDHKTRFDRIKKHYVIGDQRNSEFLSLAKIKKLAPGFLAELNRIFGFQKARVIEAVSRGGRKLSERQVNELLKWLNQ